MNSILPSKIFKSIHKMHLRCFGVNMHPCYHIRFFFLCSRGAQVSAKDIHGILSNSSLCLKFNMTFTTQNVSFGTKFFLSTIYPKGRNKSFHAAAVTAAIYGLLRCYRLICLTNMFYSDPTMATYNH